MSDNEMAMVDTLPCSNYRSTFSRFSPFVRRNSELVSSPTSLPAHVPGRPPDSISSAPPFTLESLAAELELKLGTSPNGGFNYLSGDLYNAPFTRGPLLKSRSFPTVRDDQARSTSPPPLRKTKSVRFADSQGLPLVEAVHQLTKQDSSYTANKIVPYSDDLSANVHLATGSRVSSTSDKDSSNSDSIKKESSSNSDTLTELTVDTTPTILKKPSQTSPILKRQNSPPSPVSSAPSPRRIFGFTQPSLEPDFFQRVNRQCVVLDNVREESRSLHGTIRVANLDYEKSVIIRWTHDNWRTSHDTKAVFCANDGATDRFTFELPINGDDVIFCIRYKTLGQEYWDNNRGNNYVIYS